VEVQAAVTQQLAAGAAVAQQQGKQLVQPHLGGNGHQQQLLRLPVKGQLPPAAAVMQVMTAAAARQVTAAAAATMKKHAGRHMLYQPVLAGRCQLQDLPGLGLAAGPVHQLRQCMLMTATVTQMVMQQQTVTALLGQFVMHQEGLQARMMAARAALMALTVTVTVTRTAGCLAGLLLLQALAPLLVRRVCRGTRRQQGCLAHSGSPLHPATWSTGAAGSNRTVVVNSPWRDTPDKT